MILDNKNQSQPLNSSGKTDAPRRPNEAGTIRVEAYFRIFDPQENRTIVEGRA